MGENLISWLLTAISNYVWLLVVNNLYLFQSKQRDDRLSVLYDFEYSKGWKKKQLRAISANEKYSRCRQ